MKVWEPRENSFCYVKNSVDMMQKVSTIFRQIVC